MSQRDLCSAQRVLVDASLAVAAAASGSVLSAGTYTYRVQWTLPADLPPSFEDDGDGVASALPVLDAQSHMPRTLTPQRAHIRYAATALLTYRRPADSDDSAPLRLTRQVAVRVVEAVTAPMLLQPPLTRTLEQRFLLSSGALSITVTLGNGGALFAGQALFVRIQVRNRSARSVSSLALSVHERSTLRAPLTTPEADKSFVHEFHRERHLLEAPIADSAIAADSDWTRELMLPIPLSTPPTVTQHAQHIRRIYELQVEAEVALGTNALLTLPLHVYAWATQLGADLPKSMPIALDAKSDAK